MMTQMLVELNYIFFSLLLVVYAVWRYFKQQNKRFFYFTLSFTFLTLSAIFRALNSILPYGIYFNVTVLRLLELFALALFACFTVCAIIALKKT